MRNFASVSCKLKLFIIFGMTILLFTIYISNNCFERRFSRIICFVFVWVLSVDIDAQTIVPITVLSSFAKSVAKPTGLL